MDTLEKRVMRDNQNRTRIQILQHLQAAMREIKGYERVVLTLEPSKDSDYILITYNNNYTKRVDITADSELAMILDVTQKVMY